MGTHSKSEMRRIEVMKEADARPPREWWLPLITLIVNSDQNRPDGIHVIEKSAYDQLAQRLEERERELRKVEDGSLFREVVELRREVAEATAAYDYCNEELAEAKSELAHMSEIAKLKKE